ncbi:uncharacterized protein UV8b_01191 [Ustilaginoidea virens]|uniref:Uncharacterized protein n=1 Tax=Ustilaginoidea virens TaxID=1159556 RepID=A0A8E5HKI4_USTVR|nr:uncharacterized protein UV8b_01191 [Ustilaginoidea virens]QUC16950.1 hypothetical protein UV8b_01191 [Ustilaginoidea virens]
MQLRFWLTTPDNEWHFFICAPRIRRFSVDHWGSKPQPSAPNTHSHQLSKGWQLLHQSLCYVPTSIKKSAYSGVSSRQNSHSPPPLSLTLTRYIKVPNQLIASDYSSELARGDCEVLVTP